MMACHCYIKDVSVVTTMERTFSYSLIETYKITKESALYHDDDVASCFGFFRKYDIIFRI